MLSTTGRIRPPDATVHSVTTKKPPRRAQPPRRPRARVRLTPDLRRQQLIDVTARLLTEQGAAAVEISEVAKLAGVTRPVVYRFFPSRLDLLEAVLEDFVGDLSARFQEALVRTMRGTLPEITEAFLNACCDAIEARGQGPWHLLYARSFDREAARLGSAVHDRLMGPWLPRVVELTGLPRARVGLFADIVVAAGRAALNGWLLGPLSRKEAVRVATRVVTALLRDFAAESK